MRHPSRLVLLLAVAGVLSSCASWHRPGPAVPESAPVFRFGLRGPSSAGVVQAFTRGPNTYVQFLDIHKARPTFLDPAGASLPFSVVGEYAVLAGELAAFAAVTQHGSVLVYTIGREGPAPAAAAVAAAPAETPEPARSPRVAALMRTTFRFAPGQTDLDSLTSAQARELVDAAEALLLVHPHEVRVVSRADPMGSPQATFRANERRAETVATVLRARGLHNVLAIGTLDHESRCVAFTSTKEKQRCLHSSERVTIEAIGTRSM